MLVAVWRGVLRCSDAYCSCEMHLGTQASVLQCHSVWRCILRCTGRLRLRLVMFALPGHVVARCCGGCCSGAVLWCTLYGKACCGVAISADALQYVCVHMAAQQSMQYVKQLSSDIPLIPGLNPFHSSDRFLLRAVRLIAPDNFTTEGRSFTRKFATLLFALCHCIFCRPWMQMLLSPHSLHVDFRRPWMHILPRTPCISISVGRGCKCRTPASITNKSKPPY